MTTASTVPAAATAQATLVAKQPCVVAGLDVAREVFAQIDSAVRFEPLRADGEACDAGALLARISGPARAILTGERTALNFLQHLSGIATRTRAFVDAAGGRLTLLDTRKTIPTLRALAKYAVRCGGGRNHRMGLFDAVLIKDNHIRLAGGVLEAVRRVRDAMRRASRSKSRPRASTEVRTGRSRRVPTSSCSTTCPTRPMRQAVALIAGRARVEISGGVTLERMPALAALGADYVSVGGVTHSAPAVDISLEVEENRAG